MIDTETTTIDVLVIEPGSWKAQRKTVERGLQSMQSLVGGNIEALSLTDEVSAYINEDGKAEQLPRNEAGDRLVKHALSTVGRGLIPGDWIAGPLVLMGQPDDEGWDTSVPESVLDLLSAVGVKIGDPGEPAVEVMWPEAIGELPVKLTGRERRSLETRIPTGIPNVWLEITTHHSKERKQFGSLALGVRTFPNESGPFTSSLYSPLDSLWIRSEPVARFSVKALREAHTKALIEAFQVASVRPDAFTGVLLKTPNRD